MAKPTIVLIPGAWHTPNHYELLLQRLRNAGYPTRSGQLPSVGSADPAGQQTVAADVDFIRHRVLMPELDRANQVVLLMHSYGGCPGAAAATGLSRAERLASGQAAAGGVVGLIFMSAFLAYEGDSLISKLPGGELELWHLVKEQTGQLDVDQPADVFYDNVDDRLLVDKALGELKLQSHASFATASPPPAWPSSAFDGWRAYVRCHQDRAIPHVAQQSMLANSGMAWHELDLEDAGHSPFLSHVESICAFVDERAREWGALCT